jgi:hypothetical protein
VGLAEKSVFSHARDLSFADDLCSRYALCPPTELRLAQMLAEFVDGQSPV